MSRKPTDKTNSKTKSNSNSNSNSKVEMEKLITEFVEFWGSSVGRDKLQGYHDDTRGELELEVRFGTRGIKRVSKLDYDNIIKKLISNGYTMKDTEDATFLRMSPEYIDQRTGQTKVSNMRVEIAGAETIQQYCRDNDLNAIAGRDNVSFTVKKPVSVDGEVLRPVNVDDWNFRMALSNEQKYGKESNVAMTTLSTWKDSKKTYRLITRNSFYQAGPLGLFRIDLSVVRESARRGKFLQPAYTFQSSGVTDAVPKYEVEIEVVPFDLYRLSYDTKLRVTEISNSLRGVILLILGALQQTNYPVSYSEQKNILDEYMKIIHGEKPDDWFYLSTYS